MRTARRWLAVSISFAAAAGCAARIGSTDRDLVPAVHEGYFVGAGGVRLFYRTVGSGSDTVVFVHGGPGGHMAQMHRDLLPLSRNRVVLYYDQRGGGRSGLPADTTALTLADHVRDLEMLRVHFALSSLTLVAHSFGPAIAANYAITHPDRVARMLFIAPIPPNIGTFPQAYVANLNARRDSAERGMLAVLQEALLSGPDPVAVCREIARIALPHRVGVPAAVTRVRQDPCDAPPEALRYAERYTSPRTFASLGRWDWRAALARVTTPTLVFYGEADLIPAAMVREWAAALPNARVIAVPGAGHYLYVERPQEFFPVVDQFLAGQWPTTAVPIPTPSP